MAIDNPHCPDDGVSCAPSGDGSCVACGRMFGDQVARDEAMRRYVEDYRAEFGDDAVLFDPFAGELGDSVTQPPEYCEHGLLRTQWCVRCVNEAARELGIR